MYNYTQQDFRLIYQKHKHIHIKIRMLNKDRQQVGNIDSIISGGNYSFDSSSDIRRTSSLEIPLKKYNNIKDELLYTHYLDIQIGFLDLCNNSIKYYPLGIYCFDSKSFQYDEKTKTLTLNNKDLICMFDSEHRGQLHSLSKFKIPAGSNLNEAMVALLNECGIKRYRIEKMGQYYNSKLGISGEVPYDLVFNIGQSYLDVFVTLRDLYPSWEFFFDKDGVFVCQQIPTLETDECVLPKGVLNDLVISESSDHNLYDIKNVIEVWGENIECDRFTDEVTYSMSDNEITYTITLLDYVTQGETNYINKSKIGFICPFYNSKSKTYIQIISKNSQTNQLTHLPRLELLDFVNKETVSSNLMIQGQVYVIQYCISPSCNFYYIGQHQIHAVSILTDHYPLKEEKVKFEEEYQCKNISYSVIQNSPFTIEKIGVIRNVLCDGDYQNINDDSIALANADYELWKAARLNDTINIQCILIPWLDVNQKVWYKRQNEDEEKQYIIKSISGNLQEGTMSLTLMNFYSLYNNEK